MEITFFPIDITYRIKDNRAVIYMFGKASDGTRLIVIDRNFSPYFYLVDKDSQPLLGMKVAYEGGMAGVVSSEKVEKMLLGKKLSLLKVYTKLPEHVPVIKDALSSCDCYEYDIPFARRYLLDKNITLLTSLTVSGNFLNERTKVPLFEADKISSAGDDLNDYRILAFDIETYYRKNDQMKQPILMIALYARDFKKVITWKKFPCDGYVELVDGEQQLIQRFIEIVESYKPDIITGYFSDGFDFPYIAARAAKYRIPLTLGLDGSLLSQRGQQVSIAGIVHLDLLKFIQTVLGRSMETDNYTLDAVAKEMLNEGKHEVEIDQLADAWDNDHDKLGKFCAYNLQDASLAYRLCLKMLPNIQELAKIMHLPLFDVSRMSFSRLVESYITSQCQAFNQVVPNKPGYQLVSARRQQTFEGALVFQPRPGVYRDVSVYDFRSLYPSIITSHNISPDVMDCNCCTEAVPGEPYRFCKNKKGFLSQVLESIIVRRMRIKDMIKKETTPLLEAQSDALKLLANSFYGYLGFPAARWYSLECAKSVTAYGRYHITQVIDKMTSAGFTVLYSDTDSIFVQGNDKDAIRQLVEKINSNLPGLMELDFEGFYPAALFVGAKAGMYGAKKKYALLDDKGRLKIKGFEIVRRNWSPISKEVQEQVLAYILKENNPQQALLYVKDIVNSLNRHLIPLEKVIIHTQLQKDIASYGNVGPHVAVAKRMASKGVSVFPGMHVSYVISAGKGMLRDRARLPEEIKDNDYDADYYVNNQVLPAVDRIFAVLGIDLDKEVNNKDQSTLQKFFK